MTTTNMSVHLSVNGKPACNNYTSYERKLSKNLIDVNCGICKRTVRYRALELKSRIRLKNKYITKNLNHN